MGVRSSSKKSNHAEDEWIFGSAERQMLKKIGLKIGRNLFAKSQSVEWLAIQVGIARSTLREIMAGRSNARILTLNAIAKGLGFKNLVEFLRDC